jgi:succinyl-diaminopimelate desuccinylase
MAALADRLAARTLELVDIASESRDEAALAAHVLGVLRDGGVTVHDAGDTCVLAGTLSRGERPLVLLAGHLDTVPAQDNRPGRRQNGAVHGLGTSDMKGALAVMTELALAGAGGGPVDLGFLYFGREELPVAESALSPLLAREPGLLGADLVLMMEPTDNAVQAGCLGNINATWTFHGVSGHSARPWLADNALEHAARGVLALAAVPDTEYDYDGLRFREAVSVTQLSGGIAQNVIPDRAVAHVNYRYPPGLEAADAERRLRTLCAADGELVIDSNAPSAPVAAAHPLVQALRRAGDLAVEPKQAWTPVAEFATRGLPAVNFGPGDPKYAHRRDELVQETALVRSYEVLERFACA